MHPGMGTTHFLPAVAGPAAAAKLLLSGQVVSGAAAGGGGSEGVSGLGFVDQVAPTPEA